MFGVALTLIIEPFGDGGIESSWRLSQMLQPHVVTSCLGLGEGKVLPQWGVTEEPLHSLDLSGESSEQKRRGFSAAWSADADSASGCPIVPASGVNNPSQMSKRWFVPGYIPLLPVYRQPLIVSRLDFELDARVLDQVLQRQACAGALDDLSKKFHTAQLDCTGEHVVWKGIEARDLIVRFKLLGAPALAYVQQELQSSNVIVLDGPYMIQLALSKEVGS
jgi:hypothetical protein